jgi:CHAT domain-containing protein
VTSTLIPNPLREEESLLRRQVKSLQGLSTLGLLQGGGGEPLSVETLGIVNLANDISSGGANIILGSETTRPNNILLPGSIRTSGGNLTLFPGNDFNLSTSVFTAGGDFTLSSPGAIALSDVVNTNGGKITLSGASIDTTASTLDSSSNTSDGGAIALSAPGNITTSNITSRSDIATGGDITFNSQAGAISSGNLDASGNIAGGRISLIARDAITVGQLNSSALTGDGGNVFLDPIGDIQVDSINAQGGANGRGGTVDITTNQFFRSLSSFTDQNGIDASISTAGGTGGGDIIIRHDGGARDIPFVVGFAGGDSVSNGTAGAITTGSGNSILPVQSFPGSYTQGNIQIITQNPTPPTPQPPTPSPQPDLRALSKDIEGNVPVTTGIDTINTRARLLLNTTAILRNEIDLAIATNQLDKAVKLIEQLRTQEFQNYFEGNLTAPTAESVSVEQTQALLSDIASKTGKTPAVIYVFSQPDQLQLIVVTPKGKPVLKTVYQANNATLVKMVRQLRSEVTEARKKTGYQATAKQLYQWLIAPLTAELQAQKIDTLVFSMDTGLRSLPLAALYDGQQFLVENYSIGLIPSINLTDTRYENVKNAEILAMGASKFTDQKSLPAVPVELARIAGSPQNPSPNRELVPIGESSVTTEGLWRGKSFINQAFTLGNLKSQRAKQPFGLIHLATHGEFNLGAPRNSYIQLWDSKLRLDQLRQLGWSNPPVELLVLSACRTALGNEEAELGFGGLAVAAGVKSAVASLWYVSDEGTLGLMSEFYQQLKTAPMKAEALRQAQIAMIKGQVRFEGGQLLTTGSRGAVPLPPELAQGGEKNLSHPAYWAAFTMIGSPW